MPLDSKLPLVQSLNDRCFARSPLVSKVIVQFHDEQKRILVVTSDGAKAEDLQPRTYLAVQRAGREGRQARARRLEPGRPARLLLLHARARGRASPQAAVEPHAACSSTPCGRRPARCRSSWVPGITGILLHEAIGHGMEADFNRKKTSTYATMIGRKVAEPVVTIVDDGTMPRACSARSTSTTRARPAQRTVLVDKGILTSYMHDRISARHYGVPPTGNGRRESYQHYVQPRMRNTYMLAGPATPEEVIRQAGKGIYVQDVGNGQVKIGEGDFAFYVSQGRMIEDGKLGAPIKDVNIMGNGPKMLAQHRRGGQRPRDGAQRHRRLRQGRPVGAGRFRTADRARASR